MHIISPGFVETHTCHQIQLWENVPLFLPIDRPLSARHRARIFEHIVLEIVVAHLCSQTHRVLVGEEGIVQACRLLMIAIRGDALRFGSRALCIRIVVGLGVGVVEIGQIEAMLWRKEVFHISSPRPIIISIVAFATAHEGLSVAIERTFDFCAETFVKLIAQSLRHGVYGVALNLECVGLALFYLFHGAIGRDLLIGILAHVGHYETFAAAPAPVGEGSPSLFANP